MVEQLSKQVMELTDKIHHLETSAAYQEDVIDNLNQTIGKQHQDIQQLQTQIRLLSEFIKNLQQDASSGIKMPNEEVPPPHY